jgi:hypothetical protein
MWYYPRAQPHGRAARQRLAVVGSQRRDLPRAVRPGVRARDDPEDVVVVQRDVPLDEGVAVRQGVAADPAERGLVVRVHVAVPVRRAGVPLRAAHQHERRRHPGDRPGLLRGQQLLRHAERGRAVH